MRELCEFTAKRGDLDRRLTPSVTALEGLMGQSTVAQRRGPDYETEIALEATCGPLRVRGRADGYDPRRQCLEEIKTLRGRPRRRGGRVKPFRLIGPIRIDRTRAGLL